MKPRTRSALVGSSLAATLVATWFAPSAADSGIAQPAPARTAATPATPAAPAASSSAGRELPLVIAARASDAAEAPTLFAAVHPSPPPAAPAPLAIAPAPAAVPMPLGPPPFKVLGRYRQGDDVVAFLQYNNENLVVREGDTVLDRYKVEKLTDDGIELRHLPGDELQTLDFGAK